MVEVINNGYLGNRGWLVHHTLTISAEVGLKSSSMALLPSTVKVTSSNRVAITTDGQARLWSDQTPVDLFFNTTDFHKAVALRARFESFGGANVPFLACKDLAVFKASYGRSQDWADLEEMWSAGSLDIEAVLGVLVRYLGGSDERVDRFRALGELE